MGRPSFRTLSNKKRLNSALGPKQADLDLRGLQIVQHLRFVGQFENALRLEFHDHDPIDDQVRMEGCDLSPMEEYRESRILFDL
jgi:hypothetical protein